MFNNIINAANKIIFGFYRVNDPKIINGNQRIHVGIKIDDKNYRYGFIVDESLKLVPHFYKINEPIVKCKLNKEYMTNEDIKYISFINSKMC